MQDSNTYQKKSISQLRRVKGLDNHVTGRYLSVAVERFGKNYIKTGNPDEIRYNCPFCLDRRGKADDDAKFYVNITKGKFLCFKCGVRGRLGSHVQESPYDFYEKLLKYFDSRHESDIVDDDDENVYYIPNIEIPDESLAFEYCIKRGITRDIIKKYSIRLGIGNLFGRIVIPNIVYGESGIWTDMYSARSYINLDPKPKYYMPPGSNKSKVVFNLHRIPDYCENMFLNEGVLTSIVAGDYSIAFYGCNFSNEQVKQVASKEAKNYYCTFDGDEAGIKANEKLAECLSRLLKNESNVYIVYMPKDKDAADMGQKQYIEYVMDNRIKYYSATYLKIFKMFA
jgi:hypothetical protein